jgi:hypothetical protein
VRENNITEENQLKNAWADKIKTETLLTVVGKILGVPVKNANYNIKALHGGNVGDVMLVSGMAKTEKADRVPFNFVLKKSNRWERHADPLSWRREYDLYKTNLASFFLPEMRWPICYHAEMNADETGFLLWLEYADGVTGLNLTADMNEKAARELGRFQGKLYKEQPEALKQLTNLGPVDYAKHFYLHYKSWDVVYGYVRNPDNEILKPFCEIMIKFDEEAEMIYKEIEKLPVILNHRDFWVTNILYTENLIYLIDWDTAGLGYLGEDIASLIADEADVDNMLENYRRCVPAYLAGFAEYVNIDHIHKQYVYEFILFLFGYRLIEWYLYAEDEDTKKLHQDTMLKITAMKDMEVWNHL